MNPNEIKALVSLLEDDDREVIAHVEQKIRSLGEVIIPFLELEWEGQFSPRVQRRIEYLIHDVQLEALQHKLTEWRDKEQDNLLRGVYLVATYQYPDLDFKKIKKEIDKIYYEAWISHRTYASPYDQIRNITQTMFDKLGFVPNTQNIYAPSNSMINVVLESRRANPISLCIIFMLVAQRLHMPVYGLNLPNMFTLTYKSDETQFYINVFNRGTIFTRHDIEVYIRELKIAPKPVFFEPCSHLDILVRMVRNLILAFDKLGEPDKVKELQSLLHILSPYSDKE